jgi:hypothetical protein
VDILVQNVILQVNVRLKTALFVQSIKLVSVKTAQNLTGMALNAVK